MRPLAVLFATAMAAMAAPVDDFVANAAKTHGEAGEKAAKFLVEGMPASDKQALSTEFLTENLDLALRAREETPWAKAVPEEIFQNDVLPYAVFDEPRDPWRADFHAKAKEIVKNAKSITEAVQAINQEFFKQVNVHYNTGRKRTNQSPKESMESGMATCTGLSIILVDACRSVGIPARAAGTPMWSNGRGNHTWVEIWDGDWHFTGADEYDKDGLDRAWFTKDAAEAKPDVPANGIFATSWKKTGLAFPMIWSERSEDVGGVNVTTRYLKSDGAPSPEAPAIPSLGIRLFDKKGGERLVAKVAVVTSSGARFTAGKDGAFCAPPSKGSFALPASAPDAETKAGTSDLNDMPRFEMAAGTRGWVRFTRDGETRETPFEPVTAKDTTLDAAWADMAPVSQPLTAIEAWLATPAKDRKLDAPALQAPLSKSEASRVLDLLAADRLATLAAERKDEDDKKEIVLGDKSMRWLVKTFGKEPEGGRSLWISMHGGGGAPAEVNDQQWRNQITLYQPEEGVYIAPRAPTNTWDLWHQSHIDPMFQRLIDDQVALHGVNPEKVYIMGYSAGGDGCWQLAPRMADRWAAAAMMAGHPGDASLLSLRDLPFAIFVGGEDAAYNRNKLDAEKAAELDELEKKDAGGYTHMSRVYEGLPHWMNKKDAEAVPWMAKFTRTTWPAKIVWVQDDVLNDRFYWLQIPDVQAAKAGQKIEAVAQGQQITLTGDVPAGMKIRLSDKMLDLDQPVSLTINGKTAHSDKVSRTAGAIYQSLLERADPSSAATAILTAK
ncbi:MAG: polyhydroxyalkanoate depolymerase [Akkermansiaceae bacterium]|nr:polyhydroxyalkanoate depolymerase [Akkermansiaceae bacterium]